MSIFDALLGKPSQTTLQPNIAAARDLLLARILQEMDRGPVQVPQYFAPIPEQRYSGTNQLLASLGLDQVTPSSNLPMTDVAGVQAFSTQALADQMLNEFQQKNPEMYDQLTNMNTRNANAPVRFSDMTGGGSNSGGVGQDRADFMAEHMARQQRNFAEGVTPGNMGFAQDDKGGVVALGYEAGQVDPGLAAAAGYTRRRDTNPFDMSFSDHMSAMAGDVGNMASRVASDIGNNSIIGKIGNLFKGNTRTGGGGR
tara:strand:+ start:5902 stop:6666 length:765 start_codon:yes stop_codon:yes gene_type:complete